jgi:PAS domain S-box-containing protein
MKNLDSVVKYSQKLNLLYIEDNEGAREATLVILNEFFNNVIVAIDGQDGLDKFKNENIDIIITDINMPKINGLKMIEQIRKDDIHIPILVLSAYNESGFFIESIKLGVDGYLLKPIDIQQFLESLNKIVQKLKMMDEVYLLHQYQDITDISTIISKTDTKGIITYVNDAFCKISGYSCNELINQNHNIVRHPSNPSSIYEDLWDTIKHKKSLWRGILKNKAKNGNTFYLESTIKPILNIDGEIIEYISIKNNITDTMDQKKRLIDMTNNSNSSILTIIKIDEFDDIEKYYGQKLSQNIENEFGKELINYISDKLKFDNIFMLGNGEYAILKDIKDYDLNIAEIEDELLISQQKINNASINLEDIDYDISIVISMAYGENTYENARYGLKSLLKTKQSFIIANNLIEEERKEAEKNLNTLRMVKKALDEYKIITYFQPIIDNKTKNIRKYETLVRLVNQSGEVISPYFFLDISKKGKYYSQITWRVLEHSFNALNETDKDISINLSAIDIEKHLTREKILDYLKTNKQNAHRIVFELLEDEEMKDFKTIKDFIVEVKKFGVKIAIDDFGAGYSNFERLLDYQPDILKIDACLIKNIVKDRYSLNVVETIVDFAKKQNIQTVGEYVENKEIYDILKALGVDYSQGYFFGKPDTLN